MRIFKETHVDFVGARRVCIIISCLFILAGIVSFIVKGGFRYSIDFTGGTSLQVQLVPQAGQPDMTSEMLRDAFGKNGFPDVEIQRVEGQPQFIIKARDVAIGDTTSTTLANEEKANQTGEKMVSVLKKEFPNYLPANIDDAVLSLDYIGAKVGNELRGKAVWAMLWSLLAIIIYVWWRFKHLTYGVAGVVALFHDALVTLTVFSLMDKEISLTIVAAILTIMGYSINDTIVVYDRIREDSKLYRKNSLADVINLAVNHTLSRTIITAGTTLLAVIALLLVGGPVIRDFALAMLVGIITGTYSSIFIASPIVIEWQNWREKRMAAQAAQNKK